MINSPADDFQARVFLRERARRVALPLAVAATAFVSAAFADPGVDKSGYHLFRPVPADALRDLVGDRPDGTESPTTVDAGHFQIETSFIEWARDRSGGATAEEFLFGATNLRIGLLQHLELQVIFDLYARTEAKEGRGPVERADGFSDVTLRPKLNLWGNDGGSTALALLPSLKIPTGTELSNGEAEGGLAVPFSADLGAGLDLGLMAEVQWLHDEDSGGHEAEFIHTAVIGRDLTEVIGVYLEYIGIAGPGAYQPHLSSGATWSLDANTALDFGVIAGLNDHAEDIRIFSGITVRF